ncbi:hypothetical protein H9Y04_09645 [Streptomyces sp. TRM66268-LWL]|uniref:Uncharacterized protein n=1 Tax=Streptomyces polyasparticus TaxID=2767826 RepID=A0ABR7SBI9_9ACTN|nr:hypothetical protein [Streptomyces polyasparticus]MBC9712835.1 hypothetical protein [Streptomyces polyasparticus]
MKGLLHFLGFILLVQGAGAVVHELFGWARWGFIQKLSLFDGWELYAGVSAIVLALALFAAAESAKS